MHATANVIAISSDRPLYPQSNSRWFGCAAQKQKLRLVLSYYSPDGNEVSMPLASISAYLKRDFPWVEIILKPILILRDAEQYNPTNFAASIAELQPDLIAFSVMSPHWYPMEPYFAAIKAVMPELPVCVGGYQAMLSQEQTIENPHVDFICVGDGEYATGNLVQFLRGTKDGPVDGMWESLADDQVFRTEPHQIGDLAALPFPDYDIFEKDGSFADVNTSIFAPKDLIVLPVMTGRGCPYRCTYCCNTPLLDGWKTKKEFLRKYSPEAMVDELIRLRDRYNVGYFEFWDELFLSNLKFVRAFFEIYKERIRLPFSINSRVEVMNEKFCESAAEAGCHTIWFGIESGDEQYRSTMLGRKMTNQQVIDAAENCRKAGIKRLTFNIVGMPLETAGNMRQTLELNRIIAPEFFFFFTYIPLRGTPLYERAKAEGLLQPGKKDLHYLSGAVDGQYTLNLKEDPERLSAREYNEICQEMQRFQQANNRLSLLEGNAIPAYSDPEITEVLLASAHTATAPMESAASVEIAGQPVPPHKRGLLSNIRNLFRA